MTFAGRFPGLAAATLVAAVTLGTLFAVMFRAGGGGSPGPGDWAAIRFTVVQAFLSAAVSVALAVPVARALARRRFRGRAALVTLLGAPFLLPSIVAVIGLLALFGRAGPISALLDAAGLPRLSIYGLQGVVLAHVFLNLPLAVRMILQGWAAIPAERFRLAAALGMGPAEIRRHLERPMLREVLPGTVLTVFLICLTSFVVALTLGGGPAATTVELAIYQAFRFDFDPGRAALLATIQFALCAAATLAAARFALPAGFGAGLDRPVERFDAAGPLARLADLAALSMAALFLVLPLVLIAARGLSRLPTLPEPVWRAAVTSVGLALASAALCVALSLALALAITRGARLFEAVAMLPLAASPLVIGTGLFLLLRPVADPTVLALPVTAVVNAVAALPFALRVLLPAARAVEADFGRLADSLSLTGPARLRRLTLPRLARPLGFAAGLSAALSMGDLSVIALFAGPDQATLPLQLYRLVSAYRMADAAGAALLLMGLSLALFWIFDRGGRGHADA